MNWDDPAERLALIQRVGVAKYQRLLNEYGDEHRERTMVEVPKQARGREHEAQVERADAGKKQDIVQ
jgi:chorismate mutase